MLTTIGHLVAHHQVRWPSSSAYPNIGFPYCRALMFGSRLVTLELEGLYPTVKKVTSSRSQVVHNDDALSFVLGSSKFLAHVLCVYDA